MVQEAGERLCLVAGLNLFDGLDIGRVEQLRPEKCQAEISGRPEHLLDARRRHAGPSRADDHIASGITAGGAGADITKIIRIKVVQLQRIVALGIDRRHGKDNGLGPQVQPCERIRRVAVGRDDGGIFICEDARLVEERIERRLVLARRLVDRVLIHDAIGHHHRQAIDEASLCNVLGLEEARTFGPLGPGLARFDTGSGDARQRGRSQ